MSKEGQPLQRPDIEQLIPHRRSFMFLESAEVLEPGRRATGQLADLSHPDFEFLRGHFPNFPVVPGAIIMETLAACGSSLHFVKSETCGCKRSVTAFIALSLADNSISSGRSLKTSGVSGLKVLANILLKVFTNLSVAEGLVRTASVISAARVTASKFPACGTLAVDIWRNLLLEN